MTVRILLLITLLLLLAPLASGYTWHVEKDGSGDFTVIQDALDAAAPADSILVGPGRYSEFREFTYTPSGPQIMCIMHIDTPNLVILGAGDETTVVGPDTLVSQINGLNACGTLVEIGADVEIQGFRFENTKFPVSLRSKCTVAMSTIENVGSNWGLTIVEGDQVLLEQCTFLGPRAVITSSSEVTNSVIESCTFDDPSRADFAIVVGNGASNVVVRNSLVSGHAVGLQTNLGGTVTVQGCHFLGALAGSIDLSGGSIVVRACRVEEGSRNPIRAAQGRIEVFDSHIGAGTIATILRGAPVEIIVRNSNILNSGALTIDALGTTAQPSDFRYNWWGTTDLQQIESWISQPDDNVLYEPILDSPVSTKAESLSSLKARFAPDKP